MYEPAKRDPLHMALDEATRHGASHIYLAQLRQYYEKIAVDNSRDVVIPDDTSSQQGEIPG